ncbi:hypothetical protein AAMO2058_001488400 [Amorphochlora amoebiformis]
MARPLQPLSFKCPFLCGGELNILGSNPPDHKCRNLGVIPSGCVCEDASKIKMYCPMCLKTAVLVKRKKIGCKRSTIDLGSILRHKNACEAVKQNPRITFCPQDFKTVIKWYCDSLSESKFDSKQLFHGELGRGHGARHGGENRQELVHSKQGGAFRPGFGPQLGYRFGFGPVLRNRPHNRPQSSQSQVHGDMQGGMKQHVASGSSGVGGRSDGGAAGVSDRDGDGGAGADVRRSVTKAAPGSGSGATGWVAEQGRAGELYRESETFQSFGMRTRRPEKRPGNRFQNNGKRPRTRYSSSMASKRASNRSLLEYLHAENKQTPRNTMSTDSMVNTMPNAIPTMRMPNAISTMGTTNTMPNSTSIMDTTNTLPNAISTMGSAMGTNTMPNPISTTFSHINPNDNATSTITSTIKNNVQPNMHVHRPPNITHPRTTNTPNRISPLLPFSAQNQNITKPHFYQYPSTSSTSANQYPTQPLQDTNSATYRDNISSNKLFCCKRKALKKSSLTHNWPSQTPRSLQIVLQQAGASGSGHSSMHSESQDVRQPRRLILTCPLKIVLRPRGKKLGLKSATSVDVFDGGSHAGPKKHCATVHLTQNENKFDLRAPPHGRKKQEILYLVLKSTDNLVLRVESHLKDFVAVQVSYVTRRGGCKKDLAIPFEPYLIHVPDLEVGSQSTEAPRLESRQESKRAYGTPAEIARTEENSMDGLLLPNSKALTSLTPASLVSPWTGDEIEKFQGVGEALKNLFGDGMDDISKLFKAVPPTDKFESAALNQDFIPIEDPTLHPVPPVPSPDFDRSTTATTPPNVGPALMTKTKTLDSRTHLNVKIEVDMHQARDEVYDKLRDFRQALSQSFGKGFGVEFGDIRQLFSESVPSGAQAMGAQAMSARTSTSASTCKTIIEVIVRVPRSEAQNKDDSIEVVKKRMNDSIGDLRRNFLGLSRVRILQETCIGG